MQDVITYDSMQACKSCLHLCIPCIMISSYAGEHTVQIKNVDIQSLLDWLKNISKGCNHNYAPSIELLGRKEIDISNILHRVDEHFSLLEL